MVTVLAKLHGIGPFSRTTASLPQWEALAMRPVQLNPVQLELISEEKLNGSAWGNPCERSKCLRIVDIGIQTQKLVTVERVVED